MTVPILPKAEPEPKKEVRPKVKPTPPPPRLIKESAAMDVPRPVILERVRPLQETKKPAKPTDGKK